MLKSQPGVLQRTRDLFSDAGLGLVGEELSTFQNTLGAFLDRAFDPRDPEMTAKMYQLLKQAEKPENILPTSCVVLCRL